MADSAARIEQAFTNRANLRNLIRIPATRIAFAAQIVMARSVLSRGCTEQGVPNEKEQCFHHAVQYR